MALAGEAPNAELDQAHEALEGDIERHAVIARQAYEATLMPGLFMASIVYHPEAQVGWHTDEEDPDVAYRIAVGTAPGWRHTTLLERTAIAGRAPLEQPIAYLVHDDDHNTVLFRNGDIKLEAHSGVIEPHAFNHSGIPSTAIESSLHTGPESLEKIERAVDLVYRGEEEAQEQQRRIAALSYLSDL